jgi:hypothetical protein
MSTTTQSSKRARSDDITDASMELAPGDPISAVLDAISFKNPEIQRLCAMFPEQAPATVQAAYIATLRCGNFSEATAKLLLDNSNYIDMTGSESGESGEGQRVRCILYVEENAQNAQ